MSCVSLKSRQAAISERKQSSESGLGSLMPIQSVLAVSRRWRERVRERRHLFELDDHVLSDIGLTRAEVGREAARPFWQPLDPHSG